MAELAAPPRFADAEPPVMKLVPLPIHNAGVGNHQEQVYTTDDGDYLYRIRYVSLVGHATGGTMGSIVVTFQALYTFGPWSTYFPSTGGLVAAADANALFGEDFLYTWSTDVSDNYNNHDSDFGRVWVGGLPLQYIPPQTQCSFLISGAGGYDGGWLLDEGHMQIEQYRAAGVGGGGGDQRVYIVPAAAGAAAV